MILAGLVISYWLRDMCIHSALDWLAEELCREYEHSCHDTLRPQYDKLRFASDLFIGQNAAKNKTTEQAMPDLAKTALI